MKHEYPSGWPPLVEMSLDCRQVEGNYIDPNDFGYIFGKRTERRPKAVAVGKLGEVRGGVVAGRTGQIAAWFAFGIDPSLVRHNEKNVKAGRPSRKTGT
jgi:hypothetical protein